MSEQATNPVADVDTSATGVAAPVTATASDDDTDTSEFDRVEAPPEDDDDAPPAGDGDGEGGDGSTGQAKPAADNDEEEVELSDGRKVKAPKELALGYLRQADYTRKTQEIGEARRALETQQAEIASQREQSITALPDEHRKVAIIEHQIATVGSSLDTPIDAQGLTLRTIDWIGFRNAVNANPEAQMADGRTAAEYYRDLRRAYDGATETLADLERERGAAQNDLKTKEDQRLTGVREQAAQALRTAREETGKVLAREIEGWSPEKAGAILQLAHETYKVAPDELEQMTDPRVWRVLHDNITLKARAERAEAALKQHQTANNNRTAQAVTPAAPAKGNAQPTRVRDDIGTEEWMKRRTAHVAKAKRG